MMTRRDAIVAALAAGTTSVALLTPWGTLSTRLLTPKAKVEASGLGRAFDEVLAGLDGTHEVGRAFVESQSPSPTTRQLAERLGNRLGTSLRDKASVETSIGNTIKADFAAGRTCRIDGWQLSETECELAGLRWQLFGDASATASQAIAASTESPGTEASAVIAEVTNWGPQSTEQGSKFNEQPDGHSGLWFVAENVPAWAKVRIDGVIASTTISEKGFTSGLFGDAQERILSTPGSYLIELYDPMRDVAQPIGELVVRPFAERALLADGSRSKVFCPVESWGPNETNAGVAENAQPDGSQGMWFIMPCAPRKVQLVFGDDRLPGTRTDRGVTCRVPLALLATERSVSIKLRDPDSGEELEVGQFEIHPPQDHGETAG